MAPLQCPLVDHRSRTRRPQRFSLLRPQQVMDDKHTTLTNFSRSPVNGWRSCLQSDSATITNLFVVIYGFLACVEGKCIPNLMALPKDRANALETVEKLY